MKLPSLVTSDRSDKLRRGFPTNSFTSPPMSWQLESASGSVADRGRGGIHSQARLQFWPLGLPRHHWRTRMTAAHSCANRAPMVRSGPIPVTPRRIWRKSSIFLEKPNAGLELRFLVVDEIIVEDLDRAKRAAEA